MKPTRRPRRCFSRQSPSVTAAGLPRFPISLQTSARHRSQRSRQSVDSRRRGMVAHQSSEGAKCHSRLSEGAFDADLRDAVALPYRRQVEDAPRDLRSRGGVAITTVIGWMFQWSFPRRMRPRARWDRRAVLQGRAPDRHRALGSRQDRSQRHRVRPTERRSIGDPG